MRPDEAAFGGLVARERAAHERQEVLEGLLGRADEPLVDDREQVVAVDEEQRLAGEEAVEPGRGGRGRGAGGEPAAQARGRLVVREVPAVEQQPVDASGDGAVDGLVATDGHERLGPRVAQVVAVDERHTAVGRLDGGAHGGRAVVVEARARGAQPDGRAHDDGLEHVRHVGDVDSAHVAVAARPRERLDGLEQGLGVVLPGRALGQRGHDGAQSLGQVGEQALLDEPAEDAEVGRLPRLLGDAGLGGAADGRAVEARLDDGDGELGCPLELPRLLEGARRAAGVDLRAPRDVEDGESVQQHRPGELGLAAQVELHDRRGRGRLEPQGLLLPREVAGQRHHRRRLGHPAEQLADDERAVDEPQGQVGALA